MFCMKKVIQKDSKDYKFRNVMELELTELNKFTKSVINKKLRVYKSEMKFLSSQIDNLKQNGLEVKINENGTLTIKTNVIDFPDLEGWWAENSTYEQWKKEFLTPEISRIKEHLGRNIDYIYHGKGWITTKRTKAIKLSENSSYLTCINYYNDENEFYLIDLVNNSVKIIFGRIGSEGRTIIKEFLDKDKAIRYYEEKVQEKLEKGYN